MDIGNVVGLKRRHAYLISGLILVYIGLRIIEEIIVVLSKPDLPGIIVGVILAILTMLFVGIGLRLINLYGREQDKLDNLEFEKLKLEVEKLRLEIDNLKSKTKQANKRN